MAAEFVPSFGMDVVPSDVASKVPSNASGNERERLRFILIGSTAYIRDMQLYLAHAGVAAVGDWSRLLPVPDASERPNSSERMSILVQYRMRGAP